MKKFIFTIILTLHFCLIVFSQTKDDSCPKLKSVEYGLSLIVFSVETNNLAEKSKLSYKWTVHNGKIIHGDNTESIVYLTDDTSILVNVKIEGLPESCSENILEYSMRWHPPFPRKIDEYNKISLSEERERLQNLSSELKADSAAKIIIKLKQSKDLIKQINFLISIFKNQDIDTTRLLFAIAENNDVQTEIWMIPNGVEIPDFENCLTFPSKDFEKLRKLFQTKPIIKKRKN